MKRTQFVELKEFCQNAEALLKQLDRTGQPISLTALKKVRATLVNTADLERTVDEREMFRQILLALNEAARAKDRKALDYLLEFINSLKL